MLRVHFEDVNGKVLKSGELLSAVLSIENDVPADSLAVTLPYD